MIRVDWKKELFLSTPLFLLGSNYILYNAFGNNSFKNFLRILAILLLFTGWILQKRHTLNRTQIVAIVIAIVVFLLNGFVAVNYAVAVSFSIFATENISETIRRAFRINLLLILILGVGLVTHQIDNYRYISTTGRERWTMGFENPNVAALFYASAIFLFLLSRKKVGKMNIGVAMLMSGVIFYYTDNRTTIVSLVIFCLYFSCMYLCRNNPKIQKNINNFCTIFVDALWILNLVSIFVINKFNSLDALLSYRISSFGRMIGDAGLTGFLMGGTRLTVDNFYYMFLFIHGVFPYIFMMIVTHRTMKRLVIAGHNDYIAFLLSSFLIGLMESSMLRPEIPFSLIVWKILLSDIFFDSRGDQQVCEHPEHVKER